MKITRMLKENVLYKQTDTMMLSICTLTLKAPSPLRKGYPYKPSTYGQHLRKCRLDNGYTQFETSLELNVYTSTIDKWQRGVTKPNLENQKRIEEFIGYLPKTQT